MTTQRTPGRSGSYDLFFSMNGDSDHTQSAGAATPSVPNLQEIAKGVRNTAQEIAKGVRNTAQEVEKGDRNTAGLVFDSAGNLYLNDTGWKNPGSSTLQSTDEPKFLAASAIGNGVADFDFPIHMLSTVQAISLARRGFCRWSHSSL